MTKLDKEKIYRFWEVNAHLSNDEKTIKYNKENGTNLVKRSLQQIHSNFKAGVDYQAKNMGIDDELIAKKEYNIMKQQKKTMLLKREVHTAARKEAGFDILMNTLTEALETNDKFEYKAPQTGSTNNVVIEYAIADLHYKGGNEDKKWTNHMISKLIDNIDHSESNAEHRVVLLGDLIEGRAAHKSQLVESDTDMVTQAIEVGNLLGQGLAEFYSRISGTKTLADVIESNHSQLRLLATGRGELKEDVGYFINSIIKSKIDRSTVYCYETKDGKVETPDSFYVHGDKGYMRNKDKFYVEFGTDKHVGYAHFHHNSAEEQTRRDITVYPSAKRSLYHYEKENGWNPTPQIIRRKLVNGKIVDTRRIYL